MPTDPGGWFAYSPGDPASLERLTDDQRAAVRELETAIATFAD